MLILIYVLGDKATFDVCCYRYLLPEFMIERVKSYQLSCAEGARLFNSYREFDNFKYQKNWIAII